MLEKAGPYNFFRIPEASEIVGMLKAVRDESLIVTYSGREVVISLASNILEKATNLIGRKVGILRLNDKLYIRRISDAISTSETHYSDVRET